MFKTNRLRASIFVLAAFSAPALESRAAEPAAPALTCDCTTETITEVAAETVPTCEVSSSADSAPTSYSRLGVRYIEAYASLIKGNHERLTTIHYGLVYNQPVTKYVDLTLGYGYAYYQDYRWAYANGGDASATYHHAFGKFKSFATADLAGARQWTDYDDAYWSVSVGVEYNPSEKLVLSASAGAADYFAAGDSLGFSADASATYWLFPCVGLYTHVRLYEQGFVNHGAGIAARYHF